MLGRDGKLSYSAYEIKVPIAQKNCTDNNTDKIDIFHIGIKLLLLVVYVFKYYLKQDNKLTTILNILSRTK